MRVRAPRELARVLGATLAPLAVAFGAAALGADVGLAAAAGLVAAVAAAALLRRTASARTAAVAREAAETARAERGLAEAERDRLASLVAELADAILIADARDRVRLANPAAERMLEAGPLVGKRLVDVVRDHEVLDAVARARAGTETSAEVERARPQRLLRVVAKPLPGGELLLALQDLSTLRRLETVRRDFVANVSHELRTPISALKAMAETLEAGAIDDRAAARDFIGRMHREIDGLAQLVNELLALTRVESGGDVFALAAVRPDALLGQARARMAPLAERAGIALAVEAAPDLPEVMADADRVEQVLANLIHNSVKFTPPGGSVRLGAEAQGGAVAFSVADTGAGIAAADLDRVFERFYKGEPSRAGGGTGLGLAIAKHIVQAHGGDIVARSDGPGRGATFTFTLPVRR